MHGGRHPGGVAVPGQDVEGGRLLAHQPVRDHVVEDQVVGPQDVEGADHLLGLEVPVALHAFFQLGHGRLVGEQRQRARLGVVQHRVQQGDRVDPVVAHLVQVGRGHHGQRPAQAEADEVDPLGAGDLADHVHRRPRALDQIVVHRGACHRRVRVAVADREHGPPVLHRPLDEAALRRQVHHVVLVDPRRTAQQRDLVHVLGLRHVLQDLDQIVAVDHFGRGGGQVAADLERARVHLPRAAVVVQHVVDEVAPPVQQAAAPGVQRPFQDGRVGRRKVGRRQRVVQERERQLGLAGLDPVQVGDRQQVQPVLPPGQVRLPQPPVRRVLLPGRVEEPLVPRIGCHRPVGIAPGEAVHRGRTGVPQPLAELQGQRRRRQRTAGHRPPGRRQRLTEQGRVVVLEQRGFRRQDLGRLLLGAHAAGL